MNELSVNDAFDDIEIESFDFIWEEWEEYKGDVPLWQHIFCGSIAGLMEHVFMYPLDTLKTYFQTNGHMKYNKIYDNCNNINNNNNIYHNNNCDKNYKDMNNHRNMQMFKRKFCSSTNCDNCIINNVCKYKTNCYNVMAALHTKNSRYINNIAEPLKNMAKYKINATNNNNYNNNNNNNKSRNIFSHPFHKKQYRNVTYVVNKKMQQNLLNNYITNKCNNDPIYCRTKTNVLNMKKDIHNFCHISKEKYKNVFHQNDSYDPNIYGRKGKKQCGNKNKMNYFKNLLHKKHCHSLYNQIFYSEIKEEMKNIRKIKNNISAKNMKRHLYSSVSFLNLNNKGNKNIALSCKNIRSKYILKNGYNKKYQRNYVCYKNLMKMQCVKNNRHRLLALRKYLMSEKYHNIKKNEPYVITKMKKMGNENIGNTKGRYIINTSLNSYNLKRNCLDYNPFVNNFKYIYYNIMNICHNIKNRILVNPSLPINNNKNNTMRDIFIKLINKCLYNNNSHKIDNKILLSNYLNLFKHTNYSHYYILNNVLKKTPCKSRKNEWNIFSNFIKLLKSKTIENNVDCITQMNARRNQILRNNYLYSFLRNYNKNLKRNTNMILNKLTSFKYSIPYIKNKNSNILTNNMNSNNNIYSNRNVVNSIRYNNIYKNIMHPIFFPGYYNTIHFRYYNYFSKNIDNKDKGNNKNIINRVSKRNNCNGIIRNNLSNLYKGVNIVVLGCIPAHALYFSTFEYSKKYFSRMTSNNSSLKMNNGNMSTVSSDIKSEKSNFKLYDLNYFSIAVSGFLATLVHDLIITPIDTLKQRIQLGINKNSKDSLKILKQNGIRSLYLSLPITLLMNIPYQIIMICTNEKMKKIYFEYICGLNTQNNKKNMENKFIDKDHSKTSNQVNIGKDIKNDTYNMDKNGTFLCSHEMIDKENMIYNSNSLEKHISSKENKDNILKSVKEESVSSNNDIVNFYGGKGIYNNDDHNIIRDDVNKMMHNNLENNIDNRINSNGSDINRIDNITNNMNKECDIFSINKNNNNSLLYDQIMKRLEMNSSNKNFSLNFNDKIIRQESLPFEKENYNMNLKNIWIDNYKNDFFNKPFNHITSYFVCAGIGGGIAAVLTNPLDVIKTRIQTECFQTKGFNFFRIVSNIYYREGMRSFFKGSLARMALCIPASAVSWGTYETMKRFFKINFNTT
ncbi:mitochondrial carrier protein, putative [Plasmodium sp. gorilla clade G2]|uniref:mitochondrial carrier protein, putative n=1 Tax=Plasmodium sp. gorilla clade G2 TaxID=880535 RepID=UPI000D21DFB3|nr:mitochondrial carrier protein, putative [Plasmodium sp. gorilla clade G2]SOV13965.1 mitochondrial carrier protein, putative [Plasmodium sp. gorilla clade G2]